MAERMAQEVPLIGNRGKVCTDPIMLMCAFRYALGRGTYIVGWVADELIEHRLALRSQWRQQIVRDIREAIGEDDAGWGIDATQWRQVVEAFFAVPAACRGCALTVDVCRTWRPLCCDACDHTPGSDADGSEPDLEVWVPPAEDCMQSDHEPCPHCASRIFRRRTGRCGDCGRRP